jgi:drug/metabolite transporter (DMT)-like permease
VTKHPLYSSPHVTGLMFGVLAALIWGAWPVLSRLGLEQSLDPYDITALRFGVAGLILLPVLLRRGFKGVPLKAIAFMTFGAGVPYLAVMMTGLSYAPAGHGGVITPSCMLTVSAIGSWALMGDKLTPSRLVGMAAIICGVITIGWGGFSTAESDTWKGDLLFVCGGLMWGTYTISSRYWSVEPLHATALVSVLSMIAYVPFYFLFSAETFITAPVDEVIFQGLLQGVFSGLLALLFYTRAVAILGIAKGSVFGALVPVTALMLAIPVLEEQPNAAEWSGLVLVSLGMITALGLLNIFPKRAKAAT